VQPHRPDAIGMGWTLVKGRPVLAAVNAVGWQRSGRIADPMNDRQLSGGPILKLND
jgi:hypothetical protein